MTSRWRLVPTAACVVLGIAAAVVAIWPDRIIGSRRDLVVYCAHDAVFADSVLTEFERRTGVTVRVVYDTEATKSLGLVNRLRLEKENPQCDVFWNNELLGTMDLGRLGVLRPYRGRGFARIPAEYRDADGLWTGFAARLRVWIVNTKVADATQDAVQNRFEHDVARIAIAKPLYGTTLTHYSLLWHVWGEERLKQWHADVRRRGLREVAGNAVVKDVVAEGVCDAGWTDTDDFFEAADEGKPVAMLPIIVDGREGPFTIVIPNTVAIIRGTRHPEEAEQLVDYLLSEETELSLARSKSRQIPLGPVDPAKLPPQVRTLSASLDRGYDLRMLEAARGGCLAWLKSESLR